MHGNWERGIVSSHVWFLTAWKLLFYRSSNILVSCLCISFLETLSLICHCQRYLQDRIYWLPVYSFPHYGKCIHIAFVTWAMTLDLCNYRISLKIRRTSQWQHLPFSYLSYREHQPESFLKILVLLHQCKVSVL